MKIQPSNSYEIFLWIGRLKIWESLDRSQRNVTASTARDTVH